MQLTSLLKDRERDAIKEITSAAGEWTSAREMVAIARKRFQLHHDHVEDLRKKDQAGMGVELEYRKARLEALSAEAELVTEIARWKRADIKAREAMGLLCGE
jgi:outer membrane protein TolC